MYETGFSDAIDCADAAAAQAAGNGWEAVRASGAGTLDLRIGTETRVMRFLAGETIRIRFSAVVAGAGVFPITLLR